MIKKIVSQTLLYSFVLLSAAVILIPFYWLVINSVKTDQELFSNPWGLPGTFHFENFVKAWKVARIGDFFFNSTIISLVSLVVTVVVSSMVAFVVTRMQFKWSGLVLAFFTFGLMIPVHATLIPLFITLRDLGLINTYAALVLPYIASGIPISVLIMSGFMREIPTSLDEAAAIDGCGMFDRFKDVILPLSKTAMITISIINFIAYWNEYIMALTLVTDQSMRTLQIGLTYFKGEHSQDYTLTFAGILMAAIPTVIFYLFMQEKIVDGVTSGAVKG